MSRARCAVGGPSVHSTHGRNGTGSSFFSGHGLRGGIVQPCSLRFGRVPHCAADSAGSQIDCPVKDTISSPLGVLVSGLPYSVTMPVFLLSVVTLGGAASVQSCFVENATHSQPGFHVLPSVLPWHGLALVLRLLCAKQKSVTE